MPGDPFWYFSTAQPQSSAHKYSKYLQCKIQGNYCIILLLPRCVYIYIHICQFEMVAEHANHETVQQGRKRVVLSPVSQDLPPSYVDGCRWVYRRSDLEEKAS